MTLVGYQIVDSEGRPISDKIYFDRTTAEKIAAGLKINQVVIIPNNET